MKEMKLQKAKDEDFQSIERMWKFTENIFDSFMFLIFIVQMLIKYV